MRLSFLSIIVDRLMDLTSRGKLYVTLCILSLIFSYLIVTFNYFPHLGFALSLFIFALFSYKYKKNKDKDTKQYLIFSLLFSILLFVRSEPLITFFNLSAALFFGFLMLLPSQGKNLDFADYLYAPFLFIFKSVFTKSDYYLEFNNKKDNSKTFKTVNTAFGILITLLLMLVVLPLLSSVNPFFQKIVLDFWNFLNIENLVRNIGLETVSTWLLRIVFFLLFIFIIPKVITLVNKSDNYSFPLSFKRKELPLLIPKSILAIVLSIFFITQLQFYFANDEILKNLDLSHSQHTKEVFAQLSLVAGIVMLLIYNGRNKSTFGNVLIWILGVQGIFLALMACLSDFEYINAWGLTYKRLYGLTFATWIMGIFILFFNDYRKKGEAALFIKKTIIFSAVTLLLINVFNFDYLIYHLQKARTGQGIDYTYLSTLSPDSLSYKDQITKLEEATDDDGYSLDVYDNKNPLILIHKIEYLQKKYLKSDLRTMNLLDFWQYQQIKSVDTKKLRAHYENILLFPTQKQNLPNNN